MKSMKSLFKQKKLFRIKAFDKKNEKKENKKSLKNFIKIFNYQNPRF